MVTFIIIGVVVVAMLGLYTDFQLSRLKKENIHNIMALEESRQKIIEDSNKLIFDYNVLMVVLEENFDEKEINLLIQKHRAELMYKNNGEDTYTGTIFSKKGDTKYY